MSLLVTISYGLAALLGAAFAAVELRMLLRFIRNKEAIRGQAYRESKAVGDRLKEASAPTVTIQLPLFNERNSADRIIRAAAAQNYPRDRFGIQVLDDSTDETTAIVARVVVELQREGVRISHVHRAHRSGYKAGALAEGLERSDADFVAVFDADFAPEADFLRRLLVESDAFDDPGVAFVQGRWAWGSADDESWLASILALLLDRHFQIQKPVRAFIGNVTTFNGSGGIWRRAAIDDAGGWASDTLTEDLDLSYRCALAGWHGRYRHDVPVFNELPGHMRAFKLQQRRWSKGNAQCFRKLTRRVLGAGKLVEDKWDEAFMLAGYAIHPLLLASLLLWPWAVLYVDRTLFWILQGFMSLGIIAAFVSFLMTLKERDQALGVASLTKVAGSLMVGMGLMVNNTVGQIQGFVTSGGEFVRTPKLPSRHTDEEIAALGADTPYTSPLHWTFFAELGVMAYCFAGAVFLVREGEGLWALAMVFWGLSFALMLQQQLVREPTAATALTSTEVSGA
ncbi:MAG: glycosyltransferase [Gemmatimonadetes bacterium]|nr:glycosyltransferase [Gemmatimonadota bacterium]